MALLLSYPMRRSRAVAREGPCGDVEELLDERSLKADHTTVWRWVQRYGPELEQRLRRHLKPTNKSWRVDESYARVKDRWCYLYRAIDFTGRCYQRLPAVSATRCRSGQTAVSQGSQRSIASASPRHQHRSGTPLRLGDSSSERGRNPAPPLPTSAGPILEQYPGAGPLSDQTTGEGQAGVSRVSRGAANNPRIRGYAHDSEGAGEVGERLGCSATDSVHQQAVRGGCMRPRYPSVLRHRF